MSAKYHLEIYEPDDADTVSAHFESDTPFMAIQRGDLLNPGTIGARDIRQVVQVEHIFWEIQGVPKHKVCVFTKAIENGYEARLKSPD